jgi:hypothetical protein
MSFRKAISLGHFPRPYEDGFLAYPPFTNILNRNLRSLRPTAPIASVCHPAKLPKAVQHGLKSVTASRRA